MNVYEFIRDEESLNFIFDKISNLKSLDYEGKNISLDIEDWEYVSIRVHAKHSRDNTLEENNINSERSTKIYIYAYSKKNDECKLLDNYPNERYKNARLRCEFNVATKNINFSLFFCDLELSPRSYHVPFPKRDINGKWGFDFIKFDGTLTKAVR